MQKFDSWESSSFRKSNPEDTKRRQRERDAAKRRREFVPLTSNYVDIDATQVCYGELRLVAKRIAQSFKDDKMRIIFNEGVPIPTAWGKVCMRLYKEGTQVTGGELWYQVGSSPKQTNHIFDVRPFFLQSLPKTAALYGTTDAPTIMEQARSE